MKIPLVLALGLLFTVGATASSLIEVEQGAKPTEGVSAKLPEFEVATIKPTDPHGVHMVGVHLYPGGRVVISATPLLGLVAIAFRLSFWQISGGDAWVQKDTYDVQAKPPGSQQASFTNLRYSWYGIGDERLREMLQALLIERFQLRFHRETKTGTVFLLERSGKPLKLRPTDASESNGYSGNVGFAAGRWVIFNATLPQLAKFASDWILHATVEDRTDLTGPFDYKQPTPPTDADANYSDNTDSFLLLISELGLKLARTKGPVETFVIDHAERPSEN